MTASRYGVGIARGATDSTLAFAELGSDSGEDVPIERAFAECPGRT